VFNGIDFGSRRKRIDMNTTKFNMFATPHISCLIEIISRDEQISGDYKGKPTSSKIAIIESDDYREPKQSEKINHKEETDKDEKIINTGKVIKIISGYDLLDKVIEKHRLDKNLEEKVKKYLDE
jgi:triacylglycerol esterase/lipase EstA (alpha/beta hydrolase family)